MSSNDRHDRQTGKLYNKMCISCDLPFSTVIESNQLGAFCMECRQDFCVYMDTEAAEIIAILKNTPITTKPGVVTQMKREAKEKTKAKYGYSSGYPGAQRQLPAAPPEPKADPVRVAALVRMMTSYGLTTPLPATLPQATAYVIARNGLFEIRQNDIATITLEAPKAVAGLVDDLKAGVVLKIPKLPFDFLRQTVAFFRAVVKEKAGAEAIVRIWWAYEEAGADGVRPPGHYELRLPIGNQEASPGAVRHNDTFDLSGERFPDGHARYLHVADIHSHNTMSAFWSGTDNADELKADEGRMFGVIGKLTSAIPEWKWRMRTREGFIDLTVGDVFDVPTEGAVPFTVSWSIIMQLLGQADAQDSTGRLRLYCPVDPFRDATFPREWLDQVNAPRPAQFHGSFHGDAWQQHSDSWKKGGNAKNPLIIFVLTTDQRHLKEVEVIDGVPKETGVVRELLPMPLVH